MSIPSKFKLPSEGNLLVAFSGGSDSLCLLSLLSQTARERTVALYVNHNLRSREELENEMELNRRNAAALGIPLVVETLLPGEVAARAHQKNCGIEAAARSLRYERLVSYAQKHSIPYILTAHHREDQCETVLMRILEGAPFWTWGGIYQENGMFLRPLLDFSKEEILKILSFSGLDFATDSTNANTRYKRNFIRHHLMPLMSEEARNTLASIAKNLHQYNENLRSVHVEMGIFCEFQTEEFLSAAPRMQEKALFEVFAALAPGRRISRSMMQHVIEKIEERKGRLETHGATFYFSPVSVRVYRKMETFVVPFQGEQTKLPCDLAVVMDEEDVLTLTIPEIYLENAVLRTARREDKIQLRSGWRNVHDFQKEYRIPQSIVLEQNGTIVAVLNRVLGGRDRLFLPAIGKSGKKIALILRKSIN